MNRKRKRTGLSWLIATTVGLQSFQSKGGCSRPLNKSFIVNKSCIRSLVYEIGADGAGGTPSQFCAARVTAFAIGHVRAA